MSRRSMIVRALLASASLATMLLAASTAHADPVVNFNVKAAANTGSIGYNGGSASVLGKNIQLSSLGASGTPLNSGLPIALSGGLLNFTTGSFSGIQDSALVFAPGGSIKITGGVSSLGIGSGTTLVQGTIGSVQVGWGTIVIQTFVSSLNGVVGAFFGLPTGGIGSNGLGSTPYVGSINLSFKATTNGLTGFSVKPIGGRVAVTTTATPTPEPTTLSLACAGVLIAGAYGWRKSNRIRQPAA